MEARSARIVLLVFDCPTPAALEKLIEGIPEPAARAIEEIVLMQEGEPRAPTAAEEAAARARALPLRFHRNPRPYTFGEARKAGFEYALREGFDHVVVMRGDGSHPPDALPELIGAALAHPDEAVLAARAGRLPEPSRASTRLLERAARGLARRLFQSELNLRLRDYLTGFRIYPARALRCVPFQLDAGDRTFDTELLIQFRAVGVPLRELLIPTAWRESAGSWDELRALLAHARAALGYRLHQLHVTRHGQYIIDHGIHYTLKRSDTGSHMQIVDAVRSGTRVLDLGCSQGLLARPLGSKGVRVSGVDARAPGEIATELEAYFQRDLDAPFELPVGREFDYVVVADVIEHVRNREQLLRGVRRYLKPEGRLIISTGNVALWFYRLSLLAGRFEYGPRGILDRTHLHLYTRATFRREIERAGFHVLAERVTALPFEIVFESTGRSGLIRALARAYHAIARLWPEMFAYQFILEAEIETLDEEATQPSAAQTSPSAPTRDAAGASERAGALRRLRLAGRVLLAGCAAWATACAPEPQRPEPPHGILLVSLDTLRADYLGAYGYSRFETSPALDAFAQEAFLFENSIVTEPWTLTSHMSLFTGLHPHRHGVGPGTPLAPEIPTVVELLRERGYRTQAFVDGGYVDRFWGFARGFEDFQQFDLGGFREIVPRAIQWLEQHGDEPFFLFLHSYDVHSRGYWPYYAKSGGRGRFSSGSGSDLEAAELKDFQARFWAKNGRLSETDVEYIRATYADGVRFVDDRMGEIFRFLRDAGLYDRTLLIVWSDHGDSLYDHGSVWSHVEVFDNTLRVPLLMRIPGLEGGRRIASVASGVDLAPTLLEIAGAPAPASMQGRSLLPLLADDSRDDIAYSIRDKKGERRFSARSRAHHLIWHVTEDRWSFFDLAADPRETRDLHPSGSAEEARLRRALEAWVAEYDAARRAARPVEAQAPDARTEQELRGLGYVR